MLKKSLSLFFMGISLVCYAQDGTLDLTFNPPVHPAQPEYNGFDREVYKIWPLQDGRVFVYGDYDYYQDVAVGPVVVLNPNGTIDDGFDMEAGLETLGFSLEWFGDAAVQPDGKIVISGRFESDNGFVYGLVRLNDDGSADTTFAMDTWPAGNIDNIALLPDGKIICAGYFYEDNNLNPYLSVVRLNSNGALDTSYSTGTGFYYSNLYDPAIYDIAVQPDGKVLVAGFFTAYNGAAGNKILRLTTSGTVDTGFVPGVANANELRKVRYDSVSQKIYASGNFGSQYTHGIIRLNANGTADSTFNFDTPLVDEYEYPAQLINFSVLQDGKLLLSGDFVYGEGKNLLMLNSNGSVYTGFNCLIEGGFGRVNTMAEANGGLYVGGSFSEVNIGGNTKGNIVKLFTEGLTDRAFNPNWGLMLHMARV